MAPRTVNYAAGETINQLIKLHLITVSHNPRRPLRKLQDMGFEPMAFCHQFGLSDDPDKRAHFVQTIREHHPEIELLAQSLADRTQIQSVVLRDFRSQVNGIWVTRYGIACGERRFIACVFRQALTGVPCPIRAIVRKMTVKEAFWLGVEENLQREEMTEVEKGLIFAKYAEEHTLVQGDSGPIIVIRSDSSQEPLPMTEVAKHFHVEYHIARGRAALATQLPTERLLLYQQGKLNLTDAIREALGEPAHKSKTPKEGRRNPLTMKQIEVLFDATPRGDFVRLETLAEVMKMDLNQALAESDERIQAAEERDARTVEKEVKRRII
jgi:hypothetical protein